MHLQQSSWRKFGVKVAESEVRGIPWHVFGEILKEEDIDDLAVSLLQKHAPFKGVAPSYLRDGELVDTIDRPLDWGEKYPFLQVAVANPPTLLAISRVRYNLGMFFYDSLKKEGIACKEIGYLFEGFRPLNKVKLTLDRILSFVKQKNFDPQYTQVTLFGMLGQPMGYHIQPTFIGKAKQKLRWIVNTEYDRISLYYGLRTRGHFKDIKTAYSGYKVSDNNIVGGILDTSTGEVRVYGGLGNLKRVR